MNPEATYAIDRALAAVEAIPAALGSMTGDQLDSLERIGADLRNLRSHADGSAAPQPASVPLQQLRRKIMRGTADGAALASIYHRDGAAR